ncbi:alpha/beta hydrolase [Brevundimonas sp.]|jgi:pimeloyl-ACP methyl ester carboxylesterase|uniref:alpha/beta fold hydrolase n=1 Tax=Brevundimonas sp. TaxID=1871086 RepID=UPI002E12E11B|nr:alpha/beta hydrolase [Brevundimonas sp.]
MMRTLLRLSAPVMAAAGLAMAGPGMAQDRPTVVLVHGAWADGSSWAEVIPHLHDAGLKVVAVQLPLSSLEADVATVTRAIEDQSGDVVLVAHSYGGVVISEAGNHAQVKSLVYVAAFAPGPNQSVNAILSAFPQPEWFSSLHADAQGWVTWPAEPMARWFSAGLPARQQAVLAAVQHPTFFGVNDGAIGGTPAWSNRPTHYVVADADQIIPAQLQMHFATTMTATITHADGGHLIMLAQPRPVADAIIAAVAAVD